MKHVVVTVDNRVLFDGSVHEVQFSENDDQVTVVGRLTAAPNVLEQLRTAVEQQKAQAERDQAKLSRTVLDGEM